MKPVVRLAPPNTHHPGDRVQEFIRLARDELDALIDTESWYDNVWHVGEAFVTKGENRRTRTLAFFEAGARVSRQQEVEGRPLAPSFIDFAKAYVRWMQSSHPVAFANTSVRLDALRAIEAAFIHLGMVPVIEDLTVTVLNTAVKIGREGRGDGRHYSLVLCLQRVHQFCMDRNFLRAPFPWKHGVSKPKGKAETLGQEAKEWRESRLPSLEALYGLAHVFRRSETFLDLLWSAVSAIVVSIPIRAHEVLQLRVDCEVFGTATSKDTGDVKDTYGIRVWPGKGNPPQVKWVPGQMASVVQEAIGRLRTICREAREVAAWYEKHPGELWLPPEYSDLRSTGRLPAAAIGPVFGPPTPGAVWVWLARHGLVPAADGTLCILDVEKAILPQLPKAFPHFNGNPEQAYSSTLIVLQRNQKHSAKGTNRCVVEQATVSAFNDWLSPSPAEPKKTSVFERWGLVEHDGLPIRMTSHAFRHWLNTVAHFRGMSDVDIAKWSGRDTSQNKAYNHVTPAEILTQIRTALDDGQAIGPMFEPSRVQGVNTPVDKREFIEAQIGSALITDYGICVHDYSLLPCQSHGDCLGCSENVFSKGDAGHLAKITGRLALAEKQLSSALAAVDVGAFGADRWVESHRRGIARLQKMLEMHSDPTIADGTFINLPDGALDNEVAMALRDRAALVGRGAHRELDGELLQVLNLDPRSV